MFAAPCPLLVATRVYLDFNPASGEEYELKTACIGRLVVRLC
jgi:hypothetical protein